jgi:diguanylate cyclase (GGDEF)-like protein
MSRVARASVPSVARDPRMIYLTGWFVAAMVLAAVFYYALGQHWHLVTWSIIGFGSAGAVVVGTRMNRPSDPLPWYLLAAAILTLITGDTTYNILTDILDISQPYPSVADAIYLLTYPLAAGGVFLMIRHRSPRRDVSALLDALVITAALALLLWVLVVTPTVADQTATWLANVVSVGYPLGDVLLFAVTLRLVTGGGVHTPAVVFLICGVLGLAGSDIAYALVRLYGTWYVGSPADLGWIVFYTSWGAAALHPSMISLTEPYERTQRVTTWRVVPLAAAALVAPSVLLVEALRANLRDGPVIAVFSAAMFLLVLIRLVVQGRELREQDNLAHTRAMVRELRHRAYRDPLTGLGNRLLFQERAERALLRARGTGGMASMLLIDLDNFKEVNDTQGHRAGDELLVAAAKRLAAAVRPGDLPVRMGGDEFAVLLADGSDLHAAEALAQRLVRVFGDPFRVSEAVVQVRASIGVATSDDLAVPAVHEEDTTSEEVLFRNADLALYAAKEDGKGTWRAYEPKLYDAAVQRLALRTSLDRAINREEFVLHYQPVVDLRGPARVTSFEALVRWQHPDLGLLPPGQFIPLAEETGQIVPLGAWILARAIDDAAQWNSGLPPTRRTRVAVNVSAFQFSGRGLVQTVTKCLETSGLPPQQLILEITETAFLHEQGGEVAQELQTLIELGVLIAIDDFGTGYSSIGYLRALHFDLLKADKSFVDKIADPDEPQHETLLRGIVQVAATLGIAVVAEGVETAAQRDLLRRMGCAYAQGFLYSPAVPLDEVPAVVAALEKGSPR